MLQHTKTFGSIACFRMCGNRVGKNHISVWWSDSPMQNIGPYSACYTVCKCHTLQTSLLTSFTNSEIMVRWLSLFHRYLVGNLFVRSLPVTFNSFVIIRNLWSITAKSVLCHFSTMDFVPPGSSSSIPSLVFRFPPDNALGVCESDDKPETF